MQHCLQVVSLGIACDFDKLYCLNQAFSSGVLRHCLRFRLALLINIFEPTRVVSLDIAPSFVR